MIIATSDGELSLPPAGVDGEVGFFDENVVMFPNARRPLALSGKKWVPLGVPEVTGRPVCGLARTAERDVLLWQAGGYVRQGKKLVRAFEIGRWEWRPLDQITHVSDGDGFYLCVAGAIREIRPGRSPIPRLSDKVDRLHSIASGLDGTVFVSVDRATPKDPAFLLWWPARREYAQVPAKLYGLRKRDDFQAQGVSPESRLAWGYDDVHWDLRAVAWETLAALPREPE
jgi:hypothetical protein